MSTNSVTLSHINRIDYLTITGGRRPLAINDTTVSLPVGHGYTVEIEYHPATDLYEVRRVYTRAARRFIKAVENGVYADMLSDSAYRASCYSNTDLFGH